MFNDVKMLVLVSAAQQCLVLPVLSWLSPSWPQNCCHSSKHYILTLCLEARSRGQWEQRFLFKCLFFINQRKGFPVESPVSCWLVWSDFLGSKSLYLLLNKAEVPIVWKKYSNCYASQIPPSPPWVKATEFRILTSTKVNKKFQSLFSLLGGSFWFLHFHSGTFSGHLSPAAL